MLPCLARAMKNNRASVASKDTTSLLFYQAVFSSNDCDISGLGGIMRSTGCHSSFYVNLAAAKVKDRPHTLDIAPLRSESPPQKRSGMARVLKGFHSFTCTPTRSSAIGMTHNCLCLPVPNYNWYSSFTDAGRMEG